MTLDPKPFLGLSSSAHNPQFPRAQGLSLAVHGLLVSLLLIQWVHTNGQKPVPGDHWERLFVPRDLQEILGSKKGGGNGSGRGLRPPMRGNPPPMRPIQIVPPILPENSKPKLHAERSIVGSPDIELPQVHSQAMGSPFLKEFTGSFGQNGPTGIGNGPGRGVGPGGKGDGLGPGEGETGYGVPFDRDRSFQSRIVCSYCPNPKYTDEARKSKFHGIVLLRVVVGADGRARDVRVTKGVGLGLDESAIAAVREWKFQPARDGSGRPVTAWTIVEVNFRIY